MNMNMNTKTAQNEAVTTTDLLTPSTTSRLENPIGGFENKNDDDLYLNEKTQFIPDEFCDNDDVSTVCR